MQDIALQTTLPDRPTAEASRLRWWDLALPVAGGFVVFSAIMLAVTVMALGPGGQGVIGKLVLRLQSAERGYLLNMGVMVVIYAAPLGVMFWIARRKSLRYFRAAPLRTIAQALAGGLLYAFAFELLQNILIHYHVVTYTPSPSELLLVPHNLTQLALGLGVASLFGPFVEEFYFRGLLLTWCRGKMPLLWAALLNAVAFGVVHLYFLQHPGLEGIFATGVIVLFGALNVWWTVRAGSLWPAFASHAAYNAAGLLLMFFTQGAG